MNEASGPRSIAGGWIGTAITGDVIGLPGEILNAARDVQAPPGLANLPPAPRCLGRDDELARLREALAGGGDTAITQASTVHGLGGVGKTTLALAYAHRYRHAYSVVWWINADSPTRIEQSLAELTRRLLPGLTADRDRVAWAMAWLQWHPGWLLVFDNVEAVADLSPYLGALGGGRHLVTSRRAVGWPGSMRTLALGTLDPEQAAELIRTTAYGDAGSTVRELQDVRALAAELGYLPLALEQAGAYLRQNPTVTVAAYHRRLPTKLDKAVDGLDAERTIARIWTQTLDALTARDPRAVELAQREQTLGATHPDTLMSRSNVACAYTTAGDARRAVPLHELVLAQHEQVLGELHPATLTSRDNLACAYATFGDVGRATPLHELVCVQREQVLGTLHPDTITSRDNLAVVHEMAGRPDRAAALREAAPARTPRPTDTG
ncbi:tetratricopeptide repeat protein [Kitasatospora griseola]|uniref:tetratricopeptide repeat protein n=1 Tax=Kitasatospora griseola TaxID=2064 RepID=UPI000697F557|nr:tetratricopeptide repeat protein [Kitasatospora griseola]